MVVITQTKTHISLEQFLQFPETKPYGEYFNGKIEQKPMPQGQHSILQGRLVSFINNVTLTPKLASALPELRCTFAGVSLVPDIAVFTWNRIPRNKQGKIANRFEIHPDWVIEILSPGQSANKVLKKIIFCLEQGTQLGWLIDPEDESVVILKRDKLPTIQSNQDKLLVLEPLQEILQLSSQDLFSWLDL